ncbi:hypothetical protein L1887_20528 [Cichorium endivia]|nr:hypothetical protein L1887_20528 [Cichorium endivia]
MAAMDLPRNQDVIVACRTCRMSTLEPYIQATSMADVIAPQLTNLIIIVDSSQANCTFILVKGRCVAALEMLQEAEHAVVEKDMVDQEIKNPFQLSKKRYYVVNINHVYSNRWCKNYRCRTRDL